MAERIWDRFLTDRDREIMKGTGYGIRAGFGNRPALLVIDVSYGFTGQPDQELEEAQKIWPNACGEPAWAAVPNIQRLISAARKKGLPVIYTTGEFREDGWDIGSWAWKSARADSWDIPRGNHRNANEIIDEIEPGPRDIVIRKIKPSAFHGTPLNSFLTLLNADSLIITGTVTGGCVRASVIDGFSENYRLTVVEDGCFDRLEVAHAINLMEMNAKYADVLPASTVLEYIDGLPDGMFELPGEPADP